VRAAVPAQVGGQRLGERLPDARHVDGFPALPRGPAAAGRIVQEAAFGAKDAHPLAVGVPDAAELAVPHQCAIRRLVEGHFVGELVPFDGLAHEPVIVRVAVPARRHAHQACAHDGHHAAERMGGVEHRDAAALVLPPVLAPAAVGHLTEVAGRAVEVVPVLALSVGELAKVAGRGALSAIDDLRPEVGRLAHHVDQARFLNGAHQHVQLVQNGRGLEAERSRDRRVHVLARPERRDGLSLVQPRLRDEDDGLNVAGQERLKGGVALAEAVAVTDLGEALSVHVADRQARHVRVVPKERHELPAEAAHAHHSHRDAHRSSSCRVTPSKLPSSLYRSRDGGSSTRSAVEDGTAPTRGGVRVGADRPPTIDEEAMRRYSRVRLPVGRSALPVPAAPRIVAGNQAVPRTSAVPR